jgi:hypothetical protein
MQGHAALICAYTPLDIAKPTTPKTSWSWIRNIGRLPTIIGERRTGSPGVPRALLAAVGTVTIIPEHGEGMQQGLGRFEDALLRFERCCCAAPPVAISEGVDGRSPARNLRTCTGLSPPHGQSQPEGRSGRTVGGSQSSMRATAWRALRSSVAAKKAGSAAGNTAAEVSVLVR